MGKCLSSFLKDYLSPLCAGVTAIFFLAQWCSDHKFKEVAERTSLVEAAERLRSNVQINNIDERDNSNCIRLRIQSSKDLLEETKESFCQSLIEKEELNRADFRIFLNKLRISKKEKIQENITKLLKMESLWMFIKEQTGIDYRIDPQTENLSSKLKLRDKYHNTYIETKRKLIDEIRDEI